MRYVVTPLLIGTVRTIAIIVAALHLAHANVRMIRAVRHIVTTRLIVFGVFGGRTIVAVVHVTIAGIRCIATATVSGGAIVRRSGAPRIGGSGIVLVVNVVGVFGPSAGVIYIGSLID